MVIAIIAILAALLLPALVLGNLPFYGRWRSNLWPLAFALGWLATAGTVIGLANTSSAGGTATAPQGARSLPVVFRPEDGTFDVVRDGLKVFSRATADALIVGPGDKPRRTVSFAEAGQRSQDGAGTFVWRTNDVELRLKFGWFGEDRRRFTARLSVQNRAAGPIVVLKTAPLVVSPANGGALRLGPQPKTHRILENGRFVMFDTAVQVEAGDTPRFALGGLFPIPLRGNSVANWNHLVADLDNPRRSLVAGFLTFDRSIPTLGIGYDPALSKDGAFTTYAAECAAVFHGKQLKPGQSFDSELLYVDPLPPDPLGALEDYATAVAKNLGVTPWPKRGPGHDVPNGWNSWSGGSGTGGYGQAIDEGLIRSNLAVFAREFEPFGASWFQVDDGWQAASRGDWRWREKTFPHGGSAMARQIADTGLRPGLWIAPLQAEPGSLVATAHPKWLMPAEDGMVRALAKDREALDGSNPEVLAFLRETFGALRQQGWRWVKVDFGYLDLLGKPQFDPTLTNVEAYRQAWRALREALRPDEFLLGVGTMGTLAGIVDGERLTLDNAPCWEEDKPNDLFGTSRGFKPTVRTGTRRWYYQNRLWVNHDDLIFFRSWPDKRYPPLSFEEARTFATWIGLGGGIVKLGDKLVDLAAHADWIDVVRRLLPAWPEGARPLDVLTRDYPETYRLHVVAPAGEWDVVGLVNWGVNRDLSTNPPTPLPEAPRTYTVPCGEDGLAYEFWSETFLGCHTNSFSVTVEPRRAQVIAVRKATGVPQLLGTNRHLTQGATDFGPLSWDRGRRRLSGTLLGAVGSPTAPWQYHLAFYAPAGFALRHAGVDGVLKVETSQQGQVIRLAFALPPKLQGERVAFRLDFH